MTDERDRLTAREGEILRMAAAGLTNTEIAERLGISRNAVRYHLKELHSKLDTGSDRAVLRAIRRLGAAFALPGMVVRASPVLAFGGVGAVLGAAVVGAYLAFPASSNGDGAPRPEVVDGRYPNGCPEVFSASAGLMSLADFARAFQVPVEELMRLNPGLPPDTTLAPGQPVNVPYVESMTCGEAIATPPGGAQTPPGPPLSSPTPVSSTTALQPVEPIERGALVYAENCRTCPPGPRPSSPAPATSAAAPQPTPTLGR